jgi:hypothetical protein
MTIQWLDRMREDEWIVIPFVQAGDGSQLAWTHCSKQLRSELHCNVTRIVTERCSHDLALEFL